MNIPFVSDGHKQFFYGCLKKAANYDEYHQALFYIMGISEITRNALPEWFDFSEDSIKIECLKADCRQGVHSA